MEIDGLSVSEAITKVFTDASKVNPWSYSKESPRIPELVFQDDLLQEGKAPVSISFGLNHNDYPAFDTASMIARLCLENGVDLLECSEKRYIFGPASYQPAVPNEAIERGKEAGLELQVDWIDKEQARYLAYVVNKGSNPVSLVLPGDGSSNGRRTPTVVWSVLPADDSDATHPSPFCVDRFESGCGNMNGLSPDEIVDLRPGEQVEVGSWGGRIWELSSGEVSGEFRARLYYRNDPNHPMNHFDLIAADVSKEAVKDVRQTLDCLLISNEITFTARAWKEEWRKQREAFEAKKNAN